MMNFKIEKVQSGVGEGGIACGPVSGAVVAEAKLIDENGKTIYVSLAEVDGIPNFFKTEESVYQKLVDDEVDDAFNVYLEDHDMDAGFYEDIFEERDPEWFDLYRYLIYIVRADWDECEAFMKATEGKMLSEVEVPMSDVEEEE